MVWFLNECLMIYQDKILSLCQSRLSDAIARKKQEIDESSNNVMDSKENASSSAFVSFCRYLTLVQVWVATITFLSLPPLRWGLGKRGMFHVEYTSTYLHTNLHLFDKLTRTMFWLQTDESWCKQLTRLDIMKEEMVLQSFTADR